MSVVPSLSSRITRQHEQMSRRYDARTTIFSPEGRLYQVEYAMEAISHAGTSLGILASDGVVLAAEKKVASRLLEPSKSSEKIYLVDEHVAASVAGITADANILVHYTRTVAQNYNLQYQEPMPVEQLVQRLCDLKQSYTQFGGLRPFGVSFLYAGWDRHYGFQLYMSDPSGNYGGWRATCIGANNQAAQSILKSSFETNDNLDIQKALALAVKVLSKTMDSTMLTPDRLEFSTLTRENGKCVLKEVSTATIQKLLDDAEAAKKAEAATGSSASSS